MLIRKVKQNIRGGEEKIKGKVNVCLIRGKNDK